MGAYTSEPEEPVSIPIAVIITLIYVAAAVACFLCIKTNKIAALFCKMKSFDEVSSKAIAQLYGYMILVLMPSFLIFIANKVPFEMPTLLRVLLWILGAAGMAALVFLFFRISAKPEYAALLGKTHKNLYGILWLRISAIGSAVGVLAAHVIATFSPNFNLSNGMGAFLDTIWDFAQGQIGFTLYTILTFTVLPWAFLILPLVGLVIFALIFTLTVLANMSD